MALEKIKKKEQVAKIAFVNFLQVVLYAVPNVLKHFLDLLINKLLFK